MKQLTRICVALFLLTACQKDEITSIPSPLPVSFTASVAGSEKSFSNQISCKSERLVQGGNYLLNIIGEHKVTDDSSIQVRFTVLDFTRDGITEEKNYTLSANFTGNFIEWKNQPNSTHGKFHFFQSGQLKITKIGADYVKGQFQFVYFTFDNQGNKTGEYTVNGGEFKNLRINRID